MNIILVSSVHLLLFVSANRQSKETYKNDYEKSNISLRESTS